MVVDDEQVIASTVAMILRHSGFTAEFFTNPDQALKSARIDAPDLLISDVIMPEMTGIELAISVKEICPQCKVLLFSGQAATADLLQTARRSGHEFEILHKPVHPTDLLAAVKALNAAQRAADACLKEDIEAAMKNLTEIIQRNSRPKALPSADD
jgi:DNA-binding NtrC family response regulator